MGHTNAVMDVDFAPTGTRFPPLSYSYDMTASEIIMKMFYKVVSIYLISGKEFVSGSYDRTLRIFPNDNGHSR